MLDDGIAERAVLGDDLEFFGSGVSVGVLSTSRKPVGREGIGDRVQRSLE